MGHETNVHSIQALERRIEEGNGNAIALKRARNSLLNISMCTPPEILGRIFVWSLVPKVFHLTGARDFGGLRKGLDLTTSSSFATTGSKSHLAPQNSGVSGETRCRIGRNAITVPEPPLSTSCWTGTNPIPLFSSMNPSSMRSGVVSCRAPYDKSI